MNLFGNEHSVFVLVFWLILINFIVFYLCLKSIQYMCRRLILKFVGDENDLHRVYVMVDYNTLILL